MRRVLAVTAVIGLMVANAVSAKADSGTIPACANIVSGAGTYDQLTGSLHVEVRLLDAKCTGDAVTNDDGSQTVISANYALYVIRDRSHSGDPFNPSGRLFNITGPFDKVEFVSDDPDQDPRLITEITAPGAHVISYDATVQDDDPAVCVFSLVTGSKVTTREVEVANQPVDENGNGNTTDDTHKGNGGENNKQKPPGKFDWGTHTETQEVSREEFYDRAFNEFPGEDPLESLNCLDIDPISTAIQDLEDATGSGRDYN